MFRIKPGKLNWRRTGQWLLLLGLIVLWMKTIFFRNSVIDFEAWCPFGGIQSMITYLSHGALSCSTTSLQIAAGIVLVLATVVASKLFCSHVCPIGTISEELGRLGRKLHIRRFELGGLPDILLRSLKYGLLFITLYFTLGTNELFCRNFDPYFATITLFGTDVTLWMGILSLVLLIAGALFFRHFWCRYLCPLGAISNAFKYLYVFLVFAVILIIFRQSDIEINLVVVLTVLTVSAYLLEIIGLKKDTGLQLLRITRNQDTCTDCGLCAVKCPQGIPVNKLKVVNHPDCTMCTECMGNCPEEQALNINGSIRFRWLPVLLTIGFIMAGFILGANLTIPTVDQKWGSPEEMQRSAVFEMPGIKHVKCYGSSMTFINEIRNIPGITGAATYISDHRVVLSYDTTLLNADQVRRLLFNPTYLDIRFPADTETVKRVDFLVNDFFDKLDVVFFANMAEEMGSIYSLETVYGDTITVRFYANTGLDTAELKQRIEHMTLVYKTSEETFSSKNRYKVVRMTESDTTYSGSYLRSKSFPSFSRAFNKRNSYTNEQLASVVFPVTQYPKNAQMLPYLVNFLGKSDPYIVGLMARYTTNGPVVVVFYVKDKTEPANIRDLISKEELDVSYDNGLIEKIKNPYRFDLSAFENKNAEN